MWCDILDNTYDDSSRLSPQTHLTLQDVRLPCAHLRGLCGWRYCWSRTRHGALFGSHLQQVPVRRPFQTTHQKKSESWPCASSSRRNISCTHSSLPHAPNNMPHKSRTLWTTSIEHKLSIIFHSNAVECSNPTPWSHCAHPIVYELELFIGSPLYLTCPTTRLQIFNIVEQDVVDLLPPTPVRCTLHPGKVVYD